MEIKRQFAADGGRSLPEHFLVDKKLHDSVDNQVYSVVDKRFGTRCALKTASTKAGGLHIANEKNMLTNLQHCPGVVQLYEAGTLADSTPYIATTPLGLPVAAVLRQIPEDEKPAALADWNAQALLVLECLKQCGVVHGDIKPDNLIVDSAGRLFIIDFGCAVDVKALRIRNGSNTTGTPLFASDAALRGEPITFSDDADSLKLTMECLRVGSSQFEASRETQLNKYLEQQWAEVFSEDSQRIARAHPRGSSSGSLPAARGRGNPDQQLYAAVTARRTALQRLLKA